MTLPAFRAALLENWGLKLLSLAFAVLLWMFVVGESRTEVSLALPLELTRVPGDVVIVSRVPEAVRVRLNGPRSLLSGVRPDQLVVRLDLDGMQPGVSGFEILPSRLNLPRGVEVTYISPSVITLEADLKSRKVLLLRPRLKGVPAEGFQVAGVRLNPPQVEVEGAERLLLQLKEVPTEFIDVAGLDGTVTRPVAIALPDPALRPVAGQTVRAEVSVQPLRGEREFLQVPVAVPSGLVASPPAVDVKVEGALRALSAATAQDVAARVEVGPGAPPRGPVPVAIALPDDLRMISVNPSAVVLRAGAPAVSGSPASPAKPREGR